LAEYLTGAETALSVIIGAFIAGTAGTLGGIRILCMAGSILFDRRL
jgi:hypothetical protein